MRVLGRRYSSGIVDIASDDLRERWQDGEFGGGLEGGALEWGALLTEEGATGEGREGGEGAGGAESGKERVRCHCCGGWCS